MPAFLKAALLYQAADPEGDEGHPALHAVEGHALDRRRVDLGVPAELLVVRREVHGLLRLDERRADLSAPDPPDVRTLAAEQLGAQLVGIHRGARAGQGVDGRRGARLGIELGDLLLEQVNGLVALVGEDAQVVRGGAGRAVLRQVPARCRHRCRRPGQPRLRPRKGRGTRGGCRVSSHAISFVKGWGRVRPSPRPNLRILANMSSSRNRTSTDSTTRMGCPEPGR